MQHGRLAQYRSNLLDGIQLGAIGVVALAMAPTAAHIFALHARFRLGPNEYLVEQHAHEGFAVFAVIGCLALTLVGVHTLLVRRNATAFGWSLVAMVALAAAQIFVWAIAFPVAVETSGWTIVPADFESARARWEYALALAGGLSFVALLAFVRAVEASRPIASMAILESIERDIAVRAARLRARSLDAEEPAARPLEHSRAA